MSISKIITGITTLMLLSFCVYSIFVPDEMVETSLLAHANLSMDDEASNAQIEKTKKQMSVDNIDLNSRMKSSKSDTIDSETVRENLLTQINEWEMQRGYHLNDSIVAYFDQVNFIEHEYFSYSKSELEGLAGTGDSAAQVIYAVKYYEDAPEEAIHWLKEASINSEFTSSLNMIGMHYMSSALEKDASSPMGNMYRVDTESKNYIEGAAWHRVAMLRNDPTGEQILLDTDYAEFSDVQKQIVEERALSILENLNSQRSARGLDDYEDGVLLKVMKGKFVQLAHSDNQENTNGDDLEGEENYDSYDVIELAFDDDRLLNALKREPSPTEDEI